MADPTITTNYAQQPEDGEDPMYNPNRKSKLFFGLCDMRTAVVALNIINIVFTVIVAIILTSMYAFDNGPYKNSAISSVVAWAVLVTAFSSLGLYSSMNWRLDGMYMTTVAFGVVLVMKIIHLAFVDILVTGFLLYPHIVLAMEMKAGIMTPETFEDEEFVAEGGRDLVEMAHQYISPTSSINADASFTA